MQPSHCVTELIPIEDNCTAVIFAPKCKCVIQQSTAVFVYTASWKTLCHC